MSVTPFDPLAVLRTLDRHGVRFVVIGGIAARLWGSPSLTGDLDLCYRRDRENLRRLAEALQELHARLRGAPAGLPFLLDAQTLESGDHFTFSTDLGDVDVLGVPRGTEGYRDLAATASELALGDVVVLVASLEDLVRMKQAADRPKDRIELEVLAALREERDAREAAGIDPDAGA
ncbi:MAG: hypothetical protein ACR2MA_09005 [Egibacteraceae bacterium]